MKAEEEAQIAEDVSLKPEKHKRSRIKVEEEVLFTLETRRQSEEEGELTTKI